MTRAHNPESPTPASKTRAERITRLQRRLTYLKERISRDECNDYDRGEASALAHAIAELTAAAPPVVHMVPTDTAELTAILAEAGNKPLRLMLFNGRLIVSIDGEHWTQGIGRPFAPKRVQA